MRVICSWLLVSSMTFFMLGCGGGDKKPKAKKTKKKAASSVAQKGYKTMVVTNGGSITGTVTYGGTAPAVKKLPITKDTQVCGKDTHYDESLLVAANGGVKSTVVSIKGIKSGKGIDALGNDFVLDQDGCHYTPHVSVVPVNTPLKIKNPDGILHNIHAYLGSKTVFNKSQPKFKKIMEQSFDKAGVVTVKCDVHGWMNASIVVVDHPYHTITTEKGQYSLTDVPPGTYEVQFWQEKLGAQTVQVTVAEGASTTLDHEYPDHMVAAH